MEFFYVEADYDFHASVLVVDFFHTHWIFHTLALIVVVHNYYDQCFLFYANIKDILVENNPFQLFDVLFLHNYYAFSDAANIYVVAVMNFEEKE